MIGTLLHMISHAEALALVHAHVATLSSESVASADAEGRVLAEVLSSPAELPPFDNSAMDGFALATAGTGALADSEHVVSGTVAAGQDVGAAATGTAWEIMTGAGVPTSADAVVPIEQVQILERDGERPSRIRLRQPVRAGQHIRRRGEDVCLHDRVIEAGTVLRGAHLMLLAGLGCARVQVMRRPRVALIATGRELIGDPAQALQPGQIRDGTSSYLLSQLRAAGADVVWRGRVGDDDAAFDAALAQARTAGADLILSTGAVSRGRYDFIPDALARHAAALLFHNVAVRPGKPVLLARLGDGALYIGLPG
ncbi:molybdopterin molybdotransferase MoeA, partial [Xanthomonas oryzae]